MTKPVSALLILLALAACGGGGAEVTATTVSQGEQLIDLQKALDAGVITQEEFECEKEDILRQ